MIYTEDEIVIQGSDLKGFQRVSQTERTITHLPYIQCSTNNIVLSSVELSREDAKEPGEIVGGTQRQVAILRITE